MKSWIRRNGRVAGGLYALGTAAAFWFDMKHLGFALAFCAVILVVSAEKVRED